MKNLRISYWTNKIISNESGVTIILVAICLTVLIGLAALAVDVGYMLASRNELQNAADASALAATRQLGFIYEPMSYTDQQTYVCDPNAIILVAQSAAASNTAARAIRYSSERRCCHWNMGFRYESAHADTQSAGRRQSHDPQRQYPRCRRACRYFLCKNIWSKRSWCFRYRHSCVNRRKYI